MAGGFTAQLDIHFVAHVRDGHAVFVLHFADEVDAGVLGAAAAGQGQFAAGNLHHHRDKIFGPVQLEVIDLHHDGQVRDWIA